MTASHTARTETIVERYAISVNPEGFHLVRQKTYRTEAPEPSTPED